VNVTLAAKQIALLEPVRAVEPDAERRCVRLGRTEYRNSIAATGKKATDRT
jgi:hypothetical protein